MSQAHARIPRLLLVEDEPISATFMRTVLEGLPAQVDHADTLASALRQAGDSRHDLWLIDAHLSDGSGIELLRRLRALHGHAIAALAHTASEGDADLGQRLRQAGFDLVVTKPIAPQALLDAAQALLRGPGHPARESTATPDWDQARALSALNGQQAHVQALRELFLGELPGVREHIAGAARSGDGEALRGHLHRLQASCGFVGAARLGEAVAALRRQPDSDAALQNLLQAADALLGA